VSPKLTYAALLASITIWLGLIFAAPLLVLDGRLRSGLFLYEVFHAVCHQRPERSFQLGGAPLSVCARCLGIYAGAAAGLLLYPLARWRHNRQDGEDAPSRFWLVAAGAPILIEVASEMIGLRTSTHYSRAATGALLGLASAFYLLPGCVALSRAFHKTREKSWL
jgi:uncharacterized membrane protein